MVASGRQYESIRKLMEPVQDLIWYIADGGTTIKMDRGLEAVAEIPKEWVKKGLAVATAHPRVKEVADGIIPSFTEDGVLQEWKKLL